MTNVKLGRLEPVDPRKAWESEPADFTPWLAEEENIKLLGDTLRLDLEVLDVERGIGRYCADIVCRDTGGGGLVVIENQLDPSDHRHLGQIMTYCAGLAGSGEAVTAGVWIARRFTEEHRAALDWMNEISGDTFQFFGLEVELWRVGESLPAPKFNVIAKPNDWSRTVGTATKDHGSLSETQARNLAYWTAFRDHLVESGSRLKAARPQPKSWFEISLGKTGFVLTATASDYDLDTQEYGSENTRAMVTIRGKSADGYFRALALQKGVIEAEFGESLGWYAPEASAVRRIFATQRAEIGNRDQWQGQHEWLREKLERLHKVFALRVRTTEALPAEPSVDDGP